MSYLTTKDYEYLRRRTRELIIRKGFYVYYYRLLKTDVISSPAYDDLYKESSYKRYARFKIKVLLNLSESRTTSVQQDEFGLKINRKLTAKMFVYTPRESFTETNMSLLLQSVNLDDTVYTLPIIPQIGDYIRFPIEDELLYQRNGLNDLIVTPFFQVTNLARNSFINTYLYILQTLHRVDKRVETDLGDVIVFDTNAVTFRLDSLYGSRQTYITSAERNYVMPDEDIYRDSEF